MNASFEWKCMYVSIGFIFFALILRVTRRARTRITQVSVIFEVCGGKQKVPRRKTARPARSPDQSLSNEKRPVVGFLPKEIVSCFCFFQASRCHSNFVASLIPLPGRHLGRDKRVQHITAPLRNS